MDTLEDLVALVCAFPHLETLALDDIGWDVPDASPSHQFPVGLRRLHLGSLYKRDLLEWMRARSPVPLVKHLSLGAVSPADAQEIGEYIAVANSQLQSLRVAFNSLDAGGDAEDFSKAVDLSRCTALRSLWIDELVYFALFRLTSPFPWLVEILLQAAVLPELERITLTLYIDAAEQLDASEKPAHWTALDAVFAPPNFANLVALDVLICGEAALPSVDVALRAKLPTCASRGLLRVVACDAAGIWD
ncbi:hypothetical protein K525DRAFT_282701 [Schizophyllum commune Loenen D]|nr:hypothetical protein K525DRAFT_282701 [Schizophyllum commune Loenen D]